MNKYIEKITYSLLLLPFMLNIELVKGPLSQRTGICIWKSYKTVAHEIHLKFWCWQKYCTLCHYYIKFLTRHLKKMWF